ncbi:MAG TPA: chromate resistance protein ChrB domain-containing protein [Haliangiales bacterium]|nr:chromate resistance protein ChrB domain-containing protein [Haliangiales bacterium]
MTAKRANPTLTSVTAPASGEGRWLLLIHQIPPKPDYLRVKIWRRLQRVGAVPIKNSVYVLPQGDRAQEDFQWIVREIAAQGGDASVCEARFVDGLSDEHVEAMFHAARDAEYGEIAEGARRLVDGLRKADAARKSEIAAELERLRRRLAEVVDIDFLGAPGREAAESALTALHDRLRPAEAKGEDEPERRFRREDYRGRTWVTRKGIHVDRMASAWLIRRFIDERAAFKYVPAKGYRPERGEVRFDMFEAEFTHEGDACTFEVLIDRFALRKDPGLAHIAEIVHELDVRDGRFEREDAAGIGEMVTGICLAQREDGERLALASRLLDALYESLRRRKR